MTKYPNQGFVLWFTGLSGAGKTTIAQALYDQLANVYHLEMLDGDDVRQHLTKDLGFSRADRATNLERVSYVASLLSKHGVGILSSFISPYIEDRDRIRQQVTNFIEVFVDTPLDICEARDAKGLYAKARTGEILNFTGISDPYQAPLQPEITVRGDQPSNLPNITDTIISYLVEHNYIEPVPSQLDVTQVQNEPSRISPAQT